MRSITMDQWANTVSRHKRKQARNNGIRFWFKVAVIVLSALGVNIYVDSEVQADICEHLSTKPFDYSYWVVCEQFRLAREVPTHSERRNSDEQEETPETKEAAAL